jgi:hypothetical protein
MFKGIKGLKPVAFQRWVQQKFSLHTAPPYWRASSSFASWLYRSLSSPAPQRVRMAVLPLFTFADAFLFQEGAFNEANGEEPASAAEKRKPLLLLRRRYGVDVVADIVAGGMACAAIYRACARALE